jgi:ferredoxin-NADP reductase
MIQSLLPALYEWGVHADDVHFEAFGPASVRPTGLVTNEPNISTSACVDVRFSRSGRTLAWNAQDANLLDFAERHCLLCVGRPQSALVLDL